LIQVKLPKELTRNLVNWLYKQEHLIESILINDLGEFIAFIY